MTNATSKRNGCPQLTSSARYEGDGYGNIGCALFIIIIIIIIIIITII